MESTSEMYWRAYMRIYGLWSTNKLSACYINKKLYSKKHKIICQIREGNNTVRCIAYV